MSQPDFASLVASQRAFFLEGHTRPVEWRKTKLEAVKALFTEHHDELCDALAEVTGAFTSDDLLGAIFGRFCIGK